MKGNIRALSLRLPVALAGIAAGAASAASGGSGTDGISELTLSGTQLLLLLGGASLLGVTLWLVIRVLNK